jgi:hypothetical protein
MWLIQGRPNKSDCSIWEQEFNSLESGGVLKQPLGKWLVRPHQQWTNYYDTKDKTVYFQIGSEYKQINQSNDQARYAIQQVLTLKYNVKSDSSRVTILPSITVPATLQDTSWVQIYTVNISPSYFPSGPNQDTLSTMLPTPQAPGNQLLKIPWEDILLAASRNDLTITTDGSFDPALGSAT